MPYGHAKLRRRSSLESTHRVIYSSSACRVRVHRALPKPQTVGLSYALVRVISGMHREPEGR